MEYNKVIDILHELEETTWKSRMATACQDGSLCEWVSSLHNRLQSCRIEGFMNGSYNLCVRVRFEDDQLWVIRFPRPRNVKATFADEKVALEVEALHLIHQTTRLPVPQVFAWGLAKDHPLGLGPFIAMEHIPGISLDKIFLKGTSRIVSNEIDESDLKSIYRQMAGFMLELWNLNFDQLGSLPCNKTAFPASKIPLTWKVNEIAQRGGVLPYENPKHVSTTSEYFQAVLRQDFQQLRLQPNSVYDDDEARDAFATLSTLQALIPQMVHPDYESGPFKMICDDLGLGNLIVRGEDDLTVVGIVDLEWSYAGPAQLFASAPWWLLFDRPVNPEWESEDNETELPEAAERYLGLMPLFLDILEEEESKLPGAKKDVSTLVRWSQDSGAMWLHMLISAGFLERSSFPCQQLKSHFSRSWSAMDLNYTTCEAAQNFIQDKHGSYEQYTTRKEDLLASKKLWEAGAIPQTEFEAMLSQTIKDISE